MNTAVMITLIICATLVLTITAILIVATIAMKRQTKVMKDVQKEFINTFKED